jgi:hypothetical protein
VYRAGVVTRKIDIGDIVSKVFDLYFRYAAVLLPVAAALFLIEAAFRLLGLASTPLALVAGVVALILSTVYTGMWSGWSTTCATDASTSPPATSCVRWARCCFR